MNCQIFEALPAKDIALVRKQKGFSEHKRYAMCEKTTYS